MSDEQINSSEVQQNTESGQYVNNSTGNKTLVITIVIAVVVLAGVIAGVLALSNLDSNGTGRVRDIFIIFMAVEFLIIGVALVVLIIQLASLINLSLNHIMVSLT